MIRLKEDETYLSFAANGTANGDRQGVFRRDTRYLSRYSWSLGAVADLLTATERDTLYQHFARVGTDRNQTVALKRRLQMRPDGFDDHWTFENTSRDRQELTASLEIEGDFRDLFAEFLGGEPAPVRVEKALTPGGKRLSSVAGDGVALSVTLTFSEPVGDAGWAFTLEPGEMRSLSVGVTLAADDDGTILTTLPTYDEWRETFLASPPTRDHQRALHRAIDDLRMLVFRTPHGLYPAAGMPWFVNVFGRDALLTGMMLLDAQPGILRDVLRLLAAHQGTTNDSFREEEPGKILHEMRCGELSRTGRIPFGRYYGSVDATPLFVMALAHYVAQTSDTTALSELRPAWEGAIDWLAAHQASDGGLVAFAPSGSGLMIQSWKDSSDSMNHADGRPAAPPLSVAEVQGYAFAAFRAAAGFYRTLGEPGPAADFDARADRLGKEFHARFWIDALSTYAMAIDGEGAPLAVLSSDPGHLLWTGIVPHDIAPRLVATLMSTALWSGWGLRTLGKGEASYNPVSYHNGSVWPHDTALFAWGLSRYGFDAELRTVATAMFDLAVAQPDHRLPELIAGSDRASGVPPTAYTHACYPQAWAAASLPLLAGLMHGKDWA